MVSFRCYDNSDLIATLIMTNFHLYLIQLWWQFFQMFVYGDIVYAQTQTVSSYFHMPVRPMLSHRMAVVSFRLFCKNLENLQEFSGQMVHHPPPPSPWEKIARTPTSRCLLKSTMTRDIRAPKFSNQFF